MGLLFAVFLLVFVQLMVGFFNLTMWSYDAAISYTRTARGLIVFPLHHDVDRCPYGTGGFQNALSG